MSRADQLRAEAALLDAEAAFVAAKAKHPRGSKPYEKAKSAMQVLRRETREVREAS